MTKGGLPTHIGLTAHDRIAANTEAHAASLIAYPCPLSPCRYLDPKIRTETGLVTGQPGTPASVKVEKSAINELIRCVAQPAAVCDTNL